MVDLPGVLADGPIASESLTLTLGVEITDGFAVGGSAAYTWYPGGNPTDTAKFGDSATVTTLKRVAYSDVAKFHDSLQLGHTTAFSDTWRVSTGVHAGYGILLNEFLRLKPGHSLSAHYHLSVIEALDLATLLDPLNAVLISDNMVLHDVSARMFTGATAIQDFITVTVNLQTHLILRVVISDTIDVSDVEVLRMMYNEQITENISAEVVYQEPSGATTAWAINTRTNAVTQYENFSYNSFASVGRKYIAASSSGLYELNGPTDSLNQAVVAIMAGGYFQPNGTKLAGLKGVYLGVGGQGPGGQGTWLLKIATDDGCERVYSAVTGVGLRNTKFVVGKGLRARYYAWELVNSDGQDFDLESVEFVPMMSGRRVGGG